jgi:hypothetical protein
MRFRLISHVASSSSMELRRLTVIFTLSLHIVILTSSNAFHSIWSTNKLYRSKQLSYSNKKDDNFDPQELDERLHKMRAHFLNQEYQRPPNPAFTHCELVTEVLKALWNNYEPLPDSGFRLLLRTSTRRWRDRIFESVGAPPATASEEVVASALGEATSRPQNQFAILVGEAEEYVVSFPSGPIDYGDGSCWVECRLRGKTDNQLYAVTGWTLERRKSDGAWLVDAIDWQDFRGKSNQECHSSPSMLS